MKMWFGRHSTQSDLKLGLSLRIAVTASATALALSLTLFPQEAFAKLFKNSYLTFELPNRWDCALVDTEWVCRNSDADPNRVKEAIIILTAKEVGAADNLNSYEAHLKTQRVMPSSLGTAMSSQVKTVRQRQINGHPWVDGMHLNSEVRDYYTRYLATVKDKIAVLITFSAHQAHYQKYNSDFFKAIESLRVTNPRYLLNQTTLASSGGRETFGAPIQGAMPVDFGTEMPDEGMGGGSDDGTTNIILGLALILGAGGIYLLIKKKKGNA